MTIFDRASPFTLFDGAVGTELLLRGANLSPGGSVRDSEDDYWTGRAVLSATETLERIHEDYLRARVDVITTNTFRTNRRSVQETNVGVTAEELTERAVHIACAVRDRVDPSCKVAGSVGPVASCYVPAEAPADDALHEEHASMIATLARAGVDFVLIETMNSIREARIAASEAKRAGVPFATSFVLQPGATRLLSNEPLSAAIEAVLAFGPTAILANCIAPDTVPIGLRTLRDVLRGTDVAFGAQPNLAKPPHPGEPPGGLVALAFADQAKGWLDEGATIIGGCCGTSPAYIAALATMRDDGRRRIDG